MGDDDPDMSRRVKAVDSTLVTFSSSSTGRERKRAEACRLFNEKSSAEDRAQFGRTPVSGRGGGLLGTHILTQPNRVYGETCIAIIIGGITVVR